MLAFGFLTVFWGNFGQSFFISWYGASIQNQLNLSAMAYGSAYSLATFISGLFIMAFGGAIDVIKLKYFVVITSIGLFIAALSMWQISNLFSLVVSLFLLRFFGQGLLPHTSSIAMARYFSINRGKALSIASNGVPVGEIILPLLAVLLISLYGWQLSWLLISLSVPLLFLPTALWLLSKSHEPETLALTKSVTADNEDSTRRTLLADSRFWLAVPLLLMGPFVITGIFIHQGFILEQKGWSLTFFALTFTIYGIVHWLASIISGAMVDRFTARKLFSLTGIPFAVALLFSCYFEGGWVAIMLMAFLGAGIGITSPVFGALWAEVYGTKSLGSIRSLVTSMVIISTSLSPILLGFFIDHQASGNQILFALACYAIVATALSLFAYRKNE
jgi:MFS family permease